jgi:hypothetical protein
MSTNRFLPVHRFLPLTGLPPTSYPAGEVREWWLTDTLEGYKQRGGHPVYGERDVQYQFNSQGYRCAEFDAQADIRILAIGCSYVLGLGLAQGDLFHERFATQIQAGLSKGAVTWNLAVSGASNDYIARLLSLAAPRLNPQIVLVNFTHAPRREYISVENRQIHFSPSFTPQGDEIAKDIFGHLSALISPHDDLINFFKNYKLVESILSGRCWLFSHITPSDFEPIAHHMDLRRFVGQLRSVDRARDGMHPGPESHRILAGLYWDKFIGLGGPESFGNLARAPSTNPADESSRNTRHELDRLDISCELST